MVLVKARAVFCRWWIQVYFGLLGVVRKNGIAFVKAGRDDARVGQKGIQIFLGIFLIIEAQGGGASVGDDVRQRGKVADHFLAKGEQLVADESSGCQQQGHGAGGHDDECQLSFDGAVAKGNLHGPPSRSGRLARFSSLELMRNPAAFAAVSLIAKRTLLPSIKNWIMPPAGKK